MTMYRIYYPNDITLDGPNGAPPVLGALIVLQQHPNGTWATAYGADFFVWKWGRWNSVNTDGLLRHLKEQNLVRPVVGRIHEVLSGTKWTRVDYIGFLTWVEENEHALFGELVADEVFDALMARVLDDLVYAKENGALPS